MEFIEGKCPKCHEHIQVAPDREKIRCMFCGEEISTEEAVQELARETAPVQSAQGNAAAYEELKKEAMADFILMLRNLEEPMKGFRKQTYESKFQEYYRNHYYIVEEIEKAFCVAPDKEAFVRELSGKFIEDAAADLEKLPRKGQKGQRQVDNNLAMVAYLLPAIAEYKGTSAQMLLDILVDMWNSSFPYTNIKASTFELINSGFRRRFCYITTAVCQARNRGDDCYELSLLRDYRDSYLMGTGEGEALVQEYYNVAPTIVKHIDKREDSRDIYEGIWERYLKECIRLIEEGKRDDCREVYARMVTDLKDSYFFQ